MSAAARALVNRQNAQSSTGPRTEAGKDRSRMNALGHGMTSKAIVLPHENAGEYETMHQGLVEAHRPANDHERTLVSQIAQSFWRLQRCYAVERAFLDNRISASEDDPETAMANLFIDKAESARMRLLMRYLGGAERAHNKAIADLRKAQADRRKQEREDAANEAFKEIYSASTTQPLASGLKPGFVSHAEQSLVSHEHILPASASAGLHAGRAA